MTVAVKRMFPVCLKDRTNSSKWNDFISFFCFSQIKIVFIGQISPSERNLLAGFLPLVGAYNLELEVVGSLKFILLKFSRKSRETLTTFSE